MGHNNTILQNWESWNKIIEIMFILFFVNIVISLTNFSYKWVGLLWVRNANVVDSIGYLIVLSVGDHIVD